MAGKSTTPVSETEIDATGTEPRKAKPQNTMTAVKAGEGEPEQFYWIKVNERRQLRTTTYMPGRVYKVAGATADELGGIVTDRVEVQQYR